MPINNDPYTHIELLNGDWYCIEPYKYRGDLFWATQEDWLIASASTLHPVNFNSPTAYHPPTTRAEPEQKRESSESDTSSETGNELRSTFPNPDTLKPTNASPGAGIVQQLDQAPIFGDVAEPRDEDHKGKSKEAYLPLNPSPTLPTPFVQFTNIGSSSKENLSRMTEPVFEIPSLNPKKDYSPFLSSFTPMKRILPISLQTQKKLATVTPEDATTKGTTDGRLKGDGPEKYQGDRDKAREFMRDFVLWWMMNKNNRAFQNPLSCIALFLGKMKGIKVSDWVSLML